MSRDWIGHRNMKFNSGKSTVDATSETTCAQLRLADLWIGKTTQLAKRADEGENDLQRDLFWSLFRKYNPQKDPPPTSRIANHKIMEWLTSGATWPQTQAMTSYRKLISSSSAELMCNSLLTDPEVKKILAEQKKVERQEKEAEQYSKIAQTAQGRGDSAGAASMQQKANDAKKQAQANAQAIADKMDKFSQSPKGKAMGSALNKQAREDAEKNSETLGGWGLEDGEGEGMDAEQLKQVLSMVEQSGIQEIARLMGRAHGVASSRISSRKTVQLVVADAGLTQDLDSIFPDELMMLSPSVPDALRIQQTAELLDNGLLGVTKAVENKQEGDLVIAVDGSGSMQGTREYLAKALALGICKAAKENGQDWRVFTFGAGDDLTETITPETPVDVLLKWATFLFGGGTDFDMALRHSIGIVNKMEDKTATDIVMITDGDCQVNDTTMRSLKRLKSEYGVRVITILVDSNNESYIKTFSDATIVVESAKDIEKAAIALSNNIWKSGD